MLLRLLRILCASLVLASGAAMATDLQVSQYSFTPDPTPNGGTATFSIRITNNGPGTIGDASLSVAVASNFQITGADTFPAYCTLAGTVGAQTLTCALPALVPGDLNLAYTADAVTTGSANSTATVSSPTAGDGNPDNNTLTITPAVITGADLSTTNTDNVPSHSVPSGTVINYTIVVTNGGPNATSAIRLIDQLPPAGDFTFSSATGTDWSCSASGVTVTCNYIGAAVAGALPAITVTGTVVRTTTGTISNSASASLTSPLVGDPDPANNAAPAVITTITGGTDLQATKKVNNSTAPVPLALGSNYNVAIGITNNGPQAVTGATVTDVMPNELTIGTLPGACALSGHTVTCTAGALAANGAVTFTIPVTASTSNTGIVNSATSAPPAGVTDTNSANDTASVSFDIQAPGADLSVTKAKDNADHPGFPVGAGDIIVNTIKIKNNGPSALTYNQTTNPFIFTDQLGPNETLYAGDASHPLPTGWSCSQTGTLITCRRTSGVGFIVNNTLTIALYTVSGAATGVLSNTACSGSSAVGYNAQPADPTPLNDCATANLHASTTSADLSIVKSVDISAGGTFNAAPPLDVPGANDLFIKLEARNSASSDAATNVTVTDDLSAAGRMAGTAISVSSVSAGTVAISGTGKVTWTVGTMAASADETLIVRVARPLAAIFDTGTDAAKIYTNTATIVSADVRDPDTSNNSATATYKIEPVSDVSIPSQSISADPFQIGVPSQMTINLKESSAANTNYADGVVLTDVIDTTRFEIFSDATHPAPTTSTGISCGVTNGVGTATISCPFGEVNKGALLQALFYLRPIFPYGGNPNTTFPQVYQNNVSVTTASVESNTGNNSNSQNYDVVAPIFDLSVTKQEPGPQFDPIAYGDLLTYDIRVTNNGPSLAHNVVIVDTPAPPTGYTMAFFDAEVDPSGTSPPAGYTLDHPAGAGCAVTGAIVTCKINQADPTLNNLDNLHQIIFRVRFTPAGAPPTSSLTFSDSVKVTAAEQPTTTTPAAETAATLPNNVATQTTTVLPSSDLEVVSKTASINPASVNQPIPYTIVIRNNGVSPITSVIVTDQLPAGFVLGAFTPTAAAAGAASVSSIACTGTNTVVCTLNGSFPPDGSQVTIHLQARAAYPYSGPFTTDVSNTATITPGVDAGGQPLSTDDVPANNSKSTVVQIVQSSIAGTVFVDANGNNVVDAGEAYTAGTTVTLAGTDAFGNTVAAQNATTDASGNFSFTGLPPGTYSLVETQPGGLTDGRETAGTSGGTVNNTAFDSSATHNTIGAVALAANTAATGYLFQEVNGSSISGTIYRDLNNNGAQDVGEAGFAAADFPSSPQVRLTGTDTNGNVVNLTATVDASGAYSFTGLAPSNASGYTITEIVQPTGTADGLDRNGVGSVIVGSSGRAAPEDIAVGVIAAGQALTDRDFGEIVSATLAGSIFLDTNANATRDPAETIGLAGGSVRLTGTDAGGHAVDCTITTDATGAFSFPDPSNVATACHALSAGTYTLTETPPPGFTHVGVFVGSAGGTAGAASGANTPAIGAANLAVNNIVVAAGASAVNYNFGETGQGLAGFVYLDGNNNGVRDAGEGGISGVTVTLSGTTAGGQNVCTLTTCTATTDAAGDFTISGVPGSNATGYTLTEQSQATAPLNNYGDGLDGVGTVGAAVRGTAGNDVITGIVLNAGELGANYRFGERAGAMAGHVYVDANNDGALNAGETGIAGVIVTLSGTTAGGMDICAQRAALMPALSCSATTATDGSYSFAALPAGAYTLIESQPTAYGDGRESTGAPAGTVNNAAFGSTAATNSIASITLGGGVVGTGYDFGEIGVSLTGRIFKDLQRDGVDSGGEPGIGGVTVQLMMGSTVVGTTTTAVDGSYGFTGLQAGSYTVVETQPAGYGSSSPNSVTINLTGGVNQTVNFADTVSTIAGSVFADSSNDGVRQSGEAGIAGVTIKLTGTTAAGGPVSLTTMTDATGNFSFGDLLGGSYTLNEAQPAAYSDGKDSAGTAGGTVGNDVISAIALPGGIDATTYGFGELGQQLNGVVYVDTNLNGRQDAGEPGIPGVAIVLQHGDGSPIAATTTGADGSYNFAVNGTGDYIVIENQPNGYADAAENAANRVVLTVTTGANAPINFGERLGSISGSVYNDSNFNNHRDATEPPIAGVTIKLVGSDALGAAVSRTTVSAPDGTFSFAGLVGGGYSLIETQPANYEDSGDTPGTAGGSALPSPGDTISGVALTAGQDATSYLFGEHGPGAVLSGSVWFDANHNAIRDSNEPGKAGWTVQLFLAGTMVATTTTDNDGQYKFSDLPPGTGYALLFREPTSQAAFGSAKPNETGLPATDGVMSAGNPGGADFSSGQITQITLLPGANVQQQSLPLDPSGVVYDSVTRQLVPGATVKISGPAGFDPATQLLGGSINQSQTVGADGVYQFLLLPGAPNGVYTLTLTPPAGGSYNPLTPSTRIPPCAGTLAVGHTPDPLLVSSFDGPPPISAITSCTLGTQSTGYYLSFNLTGGISANVVDNNLPLDPILQGAIIVTKTTPMRDVERGGLVPYTITAKDVLTGAVPNIVVTDEVPAGFRYREGSARYNGVSVTPVENGRMLTFPAANFAAGETKTIDLILTVGAGVGDGEHVNQAWALNANSNMIVSNVAEATVRIEDDGDFDCSDIIGKVFDDRNGNGVEDEGEPGLPGVRVVTVAGDLITTDHEGHYHITCPQIPAEDRGSNFILKLDPRTLPTGYRLTTENPETIRLTRGKAVKMNFGASLLRIIRLDVRDTVFDGDTVAASYLPKVDDLIAIVDDQPSVLRIVYASHGEDAKTVHARVAALRSLIEHKWGEKKRRCRLIIEVEDGR